MKASPSPLTILDFAITKMEFSTIPPKTKEMDVDMNSNFNRYEVDIDFGIHFRDFIQVFITASVNTGTTKIPGYSICAEAGCIFKFGENSDKLSVEQKKEIEGYSTIYIALNALRGLISSFTANAPFGRYILPSIDLNALIANKQAMMKENKESKPKNKPIKQITKKTVSKSNNKK